MEKLEAERELKLVKKNIKKYQKMISLPKELAKTKKTMFYTALGIGIGSITDYFFLDYITSHRFNDIVLKASTISFSSIIFPYLIYQLKKAKTNFVLKYNDIDEVSNQLPIQMHYKKLLQKTLSKES